MQKHTNKVALITGAARRIGADIAKLLHENLFNILLHYNQSFEEAEQLCIALNEKREKSAVMLQADLTDFSKLSQLIDASEKAWGRLDLLVNNASRFYKTALGKITEAEWNDLLNSNLRAPLFLAQAAAPHLARQHGCIVNITDIHAEKPLKDYAIYCMTKAGLVMMTKSLAKELGPFVRVNAISPGAIMWPEGENILSDEIKEKILNRTVLDHAEAGGNEIAKAVLFFVRDGKYVTGQVLAVDGGRSLHL